MTDISTIWTPPTFEGPGTRLCKHVCHELYYSEAFSVYWGRKLMRKVLWWLIGGSRGGRNRVRIIRALNDQPMNANQLATMLDLDYKTVRNHLDKLEENNVVTSMGDEYGKTYFLTDRMEQHLDILDEVIAKSDIEEEGNDA